MHLVCRNPLCYSISLVMLQPSLLLHLTSMPQPSLLLHLTSYTSVCRNPLCYSISLVMPQPSLLLHLTSYTSVFFFSSFLPHLFKFLPFEITCPLRSHLNQSYYFYLFYILLIFFRNHFISFLFDFLV